MNWKKLVLAVVLADFAALTGYAVYITGYQGFFELLFANWASATVFADLLIALTLVTVWMWTDARKRGVSPFPYVALTATLGSIGPLVYLIRHVDEVSEG